MQHASLWFSILQTVAVWVSPILSIPNSASPPGSPPCPVAWKLSPGTAGALASSVPFSRASWLFVAWCPAPCKPWFHMFCLFFGRKVNAIPATPSWLEVGVFLNAAVMHLSESSEAKRTFLCLLWAGCMNSACLLGVRCHPGRPRGQMLGIGHRWPHPQLGSGQWLPMPAHALRQIKSLHPFA